MRQRSDGIATRGRLLAEAALLFSERGYESATTAEICSRAEANAAAINYHFGDKQSLYCAVWQHLGELAASKYPVDGSLAPDAPPQQHLRSHIAALIRRRADAELETFHRLHALEFTQPTGLVGEVVQALIEPHRRHMHATLRQLLGEHVPGERIAMCARSVVSQCLMHEPPRPGVRTPRRLLTPQDAEMLIEHVYQFSLGGIAAVKAEYHQETP